MKKTINVLVAEDGEEGTSNVRLITSSVDRNKVQEHLNKINEILAEYKEKATVITQKTLKEYQLKKQRMNDLKSTSNNDEFKSLNIYIYEKMKVLDPEYNLEAMVPFYEIKEVSLI